MRIVSVLPSATEIVWAVGAGDSLVGRSSECDYPEAVRSLPAVMRPKTLDSDRPTAEIDARVRAARASDESLYAIDLDLLARLRPDLLLTQDLCRVCSVTDEEARTACTLAGVSPNLLSIAPRTLPEVWASVEAIGSAVGQPEAAGRLAAALRARTPLAGRPGSRSVLVLEWIDPFVEAGLWTPDLIRSAGARPWSTPANEPARPVEWDRVRAHPPDLVIVSPCSFTVPRTLQELEGSAIGRALADLPVPAGTWIADEAHFSRPGPRLAEGRDLIARLLAGTPPSGRLPVVPWAPPIAAGAG